MPPGNLVLAGLAGPSLRLEGPVPDVGLPAQVSKEGMPMGGTTENSGLGVQWAQFQTSFAHRNVAAGRYNQASHWSVK